METKKIGTSKKLIVSMMVICLAIFQNSCNNNLKPLEVSEFIKSFILSYLKDDINSDLTPQTHIIKVTISENEERFNIVVAGYKKSFLSATDTSYFGYNKQNGYDIYYYGIQNEKFVTLKRSVAHKKIIHNKSSRNRVAEYDPVEFKISLFKNFKFDKMLSFKVNINEDIGVLKDLADTYLKIDNNISINDDNQEILFDVQQPASFESGFDTLLSYVYSNIDVHEFLNPDSLNKNIIIRFIITPHGEVKAPIVIGSSGNNFLDSAIVRVALKFPSFVPAKHRNEIVSSYSSISIPVDSLLLKKK